MDKYSKEMFDIQLMYVILEIFKYDTHKKGYCDRIDSHFNELFQQYTEKGIFSIKNSEKNSEQFKIPFLNSDIILDIIKDEKFVIKSKFSEITVSAINNTLKKLHKRKAITLIDKTPYVKPYKVTSVYGRRNFYKKGISYYDVLFTVVERIFDDIVSQPNQERILTKARLERANKQYLQLYGKHDK